MKRQASSGFNKEKLIFIGTSLLLAGSVYNFLSSRPVELIAGVPVTPLPVPGPLAPDKPDTRKALVKYYLESGAFGDVAVNRDRKNPFEPIDEFQPDVAKALVPAVPKKIVQQIPPKGGPTPIAIEKAPDPPAPKAQKEAEAKVWEPKPDPKALVDFSAVVTMNGMTYGLLKSKGQTIKVQVGDYLEDYKYTVAKIERQAIWVTDENDREFVARDTSFEEDAAGGDAGEEKPKPKKDKGISKDAKPVAAAPAQRPAPPAGNNGGGKPNGGGRGPGGGGGGNQGGGGGGKRGGRGGM